MNHDHGSMTGSGDASSPQSTSSTQESSSHGGAMAMVFQWAVETPIYSTAFTPKNSGQYFGALVFLIVLSIIYRALVAYKSRKESVWRAEERSRSVILAGQFHDDKASADISTHEVRGATPWRWQVDPIRALLSALNVGLHYLLMFAVMSLNVGYFFAVLIGVFLGDILFARYGH
ncbi:hypothetical protein H072_9495 [Dactylellina haptotyla CBS 200.50]|uniref:Copper transport protein n=1 Tax=Dactylellina haptotyla (strain CBS 200.50) TaxID=1284197 RepID=S8A1V0_DACHA|nr:hypothetical protein H072_9495 [Dactylellina haptotyla CBS 200.50]